MIIGRNYWLNALRKGWKRNRQFKGWENCKMIGIILPYLRPEEYSIVQKKMDEWHHEGRQVQIMRLSQMRMSKKKESLREHNVLYSNEFNWKGYPVNPDFNDFCSHQFDAVLQLCTEDFKALDFIPYLLETGLLLGPAVKDSEPYDVQIKVQERTWPEIFSEVENWLKKIKYVA